MNHDVNNSQCDLSLYGPDPGDGSVKCTCDEDQPIEPAVGQARPLLAPNATAAAVRRFAGATVQESVLGGGPDVVLTGRKALDAYSEALLQP